MIVFEDADIDRAAEAVVYGAFAHAGQLCVSIERLYVQESIFDRFVSRVVNRMATVRVGTTSESDVGPVISSAQIERIEDQIQDARTKGATFLNDPMQQGSLLYPARAHQCESRDEAPMRGDLRTALTGHAV